MKEAYEAPKAECIRFDKVDVITTSGCTSHEDQVGGLYVMVD